MATPQAKDEMSMFGKFARMFRSILMLEDTPHSIALGTAIGLFIAWTPTVGIHMILVVSLALFLRANKVAGLIAVYISNPLTLAPIQLELSTSMLP